MKMLTSKVKLAGILAVAAQAPWASARADSGVGVDTTIGNVLNSFPYRIQPNPYTSPFRDPDGMGITLYPRTPTGFLNNQPPLETAALPVNEWLYKASFEAGALFGDGNTRNEYFRMYKDVHNGFLLNNFSFEALRPTSADYVEAFGGGVGRRDQFYGVTFGRYNAWKVRLFYNETVHVFTDTFKDLWLGVGTNNLTLPGSNPAAAGATCSNPPACTTFTSPALGINAPTAQAAVNVAAARALDQTVRNADNTELSLVRKKGGLRADIMLTDQWNVFLNATSEHRTGARPFGATWAAGGGAGNIETVEPIDYRTHDIALGATYADDRTSFNLSFNGSFFRNEIDTFTFQNPYLPATALGNNGAMFTGGRYDLYPNNDFYNVKAEYAYRIPEWWNARVTAVLSGSTLRQNDDLVPWTPFSGVSGGIPGGAWDTTASLSKQSAHARIDQKLADFGLFLTPAKDFDVRAKLRFYETDNSTSFAACNPAIGQFGRLVNDGTGQALVGFTTTAGTALSAAQTASLNAFQLTHPCDADALRGYVMANGLAPNAGNSQIHDVPYEYRELTPSLQADYKLNKYDTVTAKYERDMFYRAHRERAETWEDRVKLTYVKKSIEGGTLRLSGEYDRKRGTPYNPNPNDEEFYSAFFGIPLAPQSTASLVNWVHNVDQFRKFDEADRNQAIVNGRFNYALRDDLDVGFTAQFKDAQFPDSQYGRRDRQRQNTATVDLAWQPTQTSNVYLNYSFQQAHTEQAGIQPNACTLNSTYYFYSNGQVLAQALGAVGPVTPAGTTLLGTRVVTPDNYYGVCAVASAFSPLYPTSREWTAKQNDRNHVVGLGVSYDFSRAKLVVDYGFTRGSTGLGYTYNGAALGLTPAQVAVAGAGWPNMTFQLSTLNVNLLVPVNKTVAARFFWNAEWGRVGDWHYDSVADNPTGGAGSGYNVNMLYLNTGPQKWRTNLFGVLLRVNL